MSKVEDIIAASKLNELIRKKDEDDKTCRTVLWVLAIVGAIAAVAAIAYAVYCFFTPDYLEDFEEDFDDDLIDWCFEGRQNQDLYLQFLEFRKEIEPKAIVLATIRATDKDLDNIRSSLNMMQESVDNQDKFAVADSFFHQYLFKATHNNVYAKIGKSISRLLKYSVSRTYRRNEQDMNNTLNSHKEILDAIENRDALLASELVLKVIFRAIELINKGN